MVHLVPKMMPPSNAGSALKGFLEIVYNERNQEVHESYINGFSEKNSSLRQTGHFGPKDDACSYFWICPKDFINIFHNKEAERYVKTILLVFPIKISSRVTGPFWTQKWGATILPSYLWIHSTLSIFLKFCTMKGAKRYIKIIVAFPKNFFFESNGSIWVQKWCMGIFLDPS